MRMSTRIRIAACTLWICWLITAIMCENKSSASVMMTATVSTDISSMVLASEKVELRDEFVVSSSMQASIGEIVSGYNQRLSSMFTNLQDVITTSPIISSKELVVPTNPTSSFLMSEYPRLIVVPENILSSMISDKIISSTVSPSTILSTSSRIFARSSNDKHERKQAGFQDIISGLVKLLGNKNVKVANGHVSSIGPLNRNNDTDGDQLAGSRTNNRAPPKITLAEPDAPVSPMTTTNRASSSAILKQQLSSNSVTSKTSIRRTLESSLMPSLSSRPDVITTKLGSAPDVAPTTLQTIPEVVPTAFGSELTIVSKTFESGFPSGPVTEWLPAHGVAIGFRLKDGQLKPTTATTITTTTTSTFKINVVPSIRSSFVSAFESTTSSNTNKVQLPTEISYAENSPPSKTTTSSTYTTVQPTIFKLPEVVGLPPVTPPLRSPSMGNPFVIPVDIHKIRLGHGEVVDIPDPPPIKEESVFIDGRKTYFNLLPTETTTMSAGSDSTLVNVGIGYTFPTGGDGNDHDESGVSGSDQQSPPLHGTVSNVRINHPANPTMDRPQTQLVKNHNENKTPIRIDTCIIGDESACNVEQNETCRVEGGISSCYCRLGYGRDGGLEHGCKPVVSLTVYIKVDRVNHEQISYGPDYQNRDSEKYQMLEYEAKNAVESVFSLSALAETFISSSINSFFSVGGRLIINATVQLLESSQTRSPNIKQEIRRGLIAVIEQQNQNIGQSHLYVNGPLNPIPGVQDLDECADSNLNDCSKHAICNNAFGSFKCFCRDGFLDKYVDDQKRSGRICAVCSPQYCNNRGDCIVIDGQTECKCHGNYIGSQCETDGEVLGVALGASLAALLIIALTLVCLCMWSRRWKRDQQMMGHHQHTTGTLNNHYSYFNKPSAQTANFRLPSSEIDRVTTGWPHRTTSVDVLDNFYAQPEPIFSGAHLRGYNPPTTRPPSQPPPPPPQSPTQLIQPISNSNSTAAHRAVQHLRSLPLSLTGSRSNIMDDMDEIEETDTSATKFYFPRPKSRAINNANPNNIYYDVTFPNGGDQYVCSYDKDYGTVVNAFPMKIIRPYHS